MLIGLSHIIYIGEWLLLLLTTRQQVEVVCNAVRYYGVPRIVAAGTSSAHINGLGEDVNQLSLALVAELGSEDYRDVGR